MFEDTLPRLGIFNPLLPLALPKLGMLMPLWKVAPPKLKVVMFASWDRLWKLKEMKLDEENKTVEKLPLQVVPFYTYYSSSKTSLSCPFLPDYPITPSSMTATCNHLRLVPEEGLHIMSCSLRNVSRSRCLLVIPSCKIILRCVVCAANQDSPVTSHMCVVHPQRINPELCRTAYSSAALRAY